MDPVKKYETPLHYIMAFVGGFFGVYAILSFCNLFGNAQTANLIYFVTDLLGGDVKDAALRIGGMLLFMAAIVLTVYLPKHSRVNLQVMSVLLDAAAAVLVGLFPADIHPVLALYPFFFVTAFQWNSFRGAQGFASSTLFSTNNLKQFTINVGRDGTIHQFSAVEQDDQRSSYQLKSQQNGAVDAAKFTFTPPQGVTVDDQRK